MNTKLTVAAIFLLSISSNSIAQAGQSNSQNSNTIYITLGVVVMLILMFYFSFRKKGNLQSISNSTASSLAKKYPALRILSNILSFIAWAVAILAIIIAVTQLDNSYGENSWLLPVAILTIGAILFIALLSYSEIIKVFIDIEENTRGTSIPSDLPNNL